MKLIINEDEHPDWDDYRDGTLSLKNAHAFEAYLDENSEMRDRYDQETEMLGELKMGESVHQFATSQREFVGRVMATLETDQKPSVLAKINRYLMPFAAAAAIAIVIIVGQSGFLEPQEITDARDNPVGTCIRAITMRTAELPATLDHFSHDLEKAANMSKILGLVNHHKDLELDFTKAHEFEL